MHIRLWTLSVGLLGLLGASVHISEPGICLYSSSLVTPLYVSAEGSQHPGTKHQNAHYSPNSEHGGQEPGSLLGSNQPSFHC